MTKLHSKLSQIALALVVAFGAFTFTACGADESKAPKALLQNAFEAYFIKVISQDDDTIIKDATVSGRNGKCEKYVVSRWIFFYKDMETCVKDCLSDDCKEDCKPIFDGQKLPYDHEKFIYRIDKEKCPPKNGVYEAQIKTNFGTYEYEFKLGR